MRRLAPFIFLALLGISTLACMTVSRAVFGTPTPSPLPPTATPLPPTATPIPTATPLPSPTPDPCPNGDCVTSCLNKMTDIVNLNKAGSDSKSIRRAFVAEDEYVLISYTINGDQIENPVEKKGLSSSLRAYQKDRLAQGRIWEYFASIIPFENREYLTQFIIVTDGKDNILASVAQSEDSPNNWALSVDIMDATDPQDLTFTLIHEYGHLVTLNPAQVIPSQAIFDHPQSDSIYDKEAEACPTYFSGEGCSQRDSYINLFFNRFWQENYAEWEKIDWIEDEEAYYDALERFYQKYQDQFVTDYAPTNPAEDVAETFSYFILEPKPTGETIAEQKILFFYDFPELTQLRSEIGHRLCDQLEK